jgi:hypothetical protein
MLDELGGKRFAADVVVQVRIDAQLLADGREHSVFISQNCIKRPFLALRGRAFLCSSEPFQWLLVPRAGVELSRFRIFILIS